MNRGHKKGGVNVPTKKRLVYSEKIPFLLMTKHSFLRFLGVPEDSEVFYETRRDVDRIDESDRTRGTEGTSRNTICGTLLRHINTPQSLLLVVSTPFTVFRGVRTS